MDYVNFYITMFASLRESFQLQRYLHQRRKKLMINNIFLQRWEGEREEREREREREMLRLLWFNQIQKVERNDRGLTLINSSVTDPPRYTTFDWWLSRMLFSVYVCTLSLQWYSTHIFTHLQLYYFCQVKVYICHRFHNLHIWDVFR